MGVYIHGLFLLIVVLSSFVGGQRYFLGEADVGDYFSEPADLTEQPVPFYQNPLLHSGNYYVPKDLQTSEIPVHLQETLPQYQQRIASKQSFQPNIPGPFKSSQEYVKPSTHRPNYSHLLPQSYHHEHLKTQKSYERNSPINQLEDLNGNEFETEISNGHHRPLNLLTNFSNTKSDENINPISNVIKENNNKLDSHFTKRDSTEEASEDKLSQGEYLEQSEEQVSDSGNENNQLDDSEYDEEYEYDDEDNEDDTEIDEDNQIKNETYEILTMKPMTAGEENTFNDFVDVESMDTTTQEPATSNFLTQSPIVIPQKDKTNFSELVVSVVTSKTIVNNTIISPVSTTMEMSTESTVGMPEQNSTDSWIVIASVQTSRSISGTRYIPSSVVDQDTRIQLLNEPILVTEPSIRENEESKTEADLTTPIAASPVTKTKTSTESLIDKLDRVQSDLSSGLLSGGYKNDNIAVIEENLTTKIETTTEELTTTPKVPYPQVNIRKFNAGNRAFRPKPKGIEPRRKQTVTTSTPKSVLEQKDPLSSILQKAKPIDDISALLPPGYKPPSSTEESIEDSAAILEHDNISSLLPPGYKTPNKPSAFTEKPVSSILAKAQPLDDISALLPPGYKPPPSESIEKSTENILSKAKPVEDLSALLPPGYKPPQTESAGKPTKTIFSKAKPVDDISALLPPGYKPRQSVTTEKSNKNISSKVKIVDDISALLPPGFKPPRSGSTEKSVNNLLSKAKPVEDISALLPPGYKKGFSKPKSPRVTTESSAPLETVSQSILAKLLPPGFKLNETTNKNIGTSTSSSTPTSQISTTSGGGIKLVFPSRPGGGARKTPRLTTPRLQDEDVNMNKPTSPTIQKGWPVRASTEFTGWPTPSTTPISIEKLLEAARKAATSTSTVTPTEPSSTTTTTTTTTTTSKPTTPGVCVDDCDLAGTIKLIGGAKWVPELLDPNTKEYQILANSVQTELESIYNISPVLKKWYRKIRIDGFSEGSILVDYLVEFNEIGHKVDTQEIKRLFHESLTDGLSNREGKSLNDTKDEKFSLGQFEVDPKYTDFIVIPKHSYPTVGYAEDVLLPQWAIAVIVIGLASLLFVIIFGVTVLVNRHKNSKKTPAPLTEDMLNELNKNHMGGLENYGVDDFYNMEDVWSDKHYDEQKPHKKRTNGSVYDNSTANLYDSWRSQWNGTGQWNVYNNYYGNANSSQHSGHSGFRRPAHDSNF